MLEYNSKRPKENIGLPFNRSKKDLQDMLATENIQRKIPCEDQTTRHGNKHQTEATEMV